MADGNAELRKIWQPLSIGPVTVKNRIAMPPMSTSYGTEFLNARHIEYYRERAMGGVGLITTEQQIAVGDTKFRDKTPNVLGVGSVPGLAAAGEAVHEYGAKLFVELLAPGAWEAEYLPEEWRAPKAPSRMYISYFSTYVQSLTEADIRQICLDLGRSAKNVLDAGLDGVDIHGAHGYLVQQFMDRGLNVRTDSYGGSPRNRARFAIEAGTAIRDSVHDSIAVGVRLSLSAPGDQARESDTLEVIDAIAESGVYDFLDISIGGLGLHHLTVAPMSVQDGFLVPQGARVKEVVGERAKVFIVGKVRSLALAEEIIATGAADMVSMGRALLADPWLVKKTIESRGDEIIRCIGASACSGQPMTICQLNPVTSRERSWGGGALEPAARKRRIVVVGGGPAGLKAAGIAAARGHEVSLLERSDVLGGSLNHIKRLPTRRDWQMAIDDLAWMAAKRGVKIELKTEASAAILKELSPDAVVFATGTQLGLSTPQWWSTDDEPESVPKLMELRSAIESSAGGQDVFGKRVLVVDETGGFAPFGLAESLAAQGIRVQMIASRNVMSLGVLNDDVPLLFPRLAQLGVHWRSETAVRGLDRSGVQIGNVWGGEAETYPAIDTVIVSQLLQPDDALFRECGTSVESYLIGDAMAPRLVRHALFEGEKLAREI